MTASTFVGLEAAVVVDVPHNVRELAGYLGSRVHAPGYDADAGPPPSNRVQGHTHAPVVNEFPKHLRDVLYVVRVALFEGAGRDEELRVEDEGPR